MDFDKIFNYILAFMAGVILYILCDKIFNIEGITTPTPTPTPTTTATPTPLPCCLPLCRRCHYKFDNSEDLKTALGEYIVNKTNAIDKYGDISTWDVSSVTDMSGLFQFQHATSFNEDISNWDVSSVTNMSNMFTDAKVFNQDLSNWNVSSVTDMTGMFRNAEAFNQDISNWNVSSVTDMTGMFRNAEAFNQDLSRWDVSNVTNMSNMFRDATSFNGNISNWNVSSVSSMSGMFFGATAFNGNIKNWNVSNVRDMSAMFYGAKEFNQDISGWTFGEIFNMRDMFNGASSFNQDLSGWDFSSVYSGCIELDRMWDNTSISDNQKPSDTLTIYCMRSLWTPILRAELEGMNHNDLEKRAISAGVAPATIEEVLSGPVNEDVLDSLVNMIIISQGQPVGGDAEAVRNKYYNLIHSPNPTPL